MELGVNFVDSFQNDVVSKIMSYLDDSADLIRASAVSRSWCHFVISNCLSKKLCLRKVPSLASITACVVEENDWIVKMSDNAVSRNPVDWEALVREHKIYTSLLQVLATPIGIPQECTALTVAVLSSMASFDPDDDILIVQDPSDRSPDGYWPTVPNVPEHIIYQLKSPTCIVKEILLLPFEGDHSSMISCSLVDWKLIWPTNSGMSIRFRMGHPKSAADLVEMNGTHARPSEQPSLDNYVWTYTSPVFPLDRDSDMQLFKLPEPTICMGGFLHVEVLDRIQREELRGLFYIFLRHFSVLGVPLEPAFKLEMFASGELRLKYSPCVLQDVLSGPWFRPPSISSSTGRLAPCL